MRALSIGARKRLFAITLVACGLVIIVAAAFLPQFLKPMGLLFVVGRFLAPGLILLGAVAILFPRVIIDPTLDVDDPPEERVHETRDPVSILFPLVCLAAGAVFHWFVLA